MYLFFRDTPNIKSTRCEFDSSIICDFFNFLPTIFAFYTRNYTKIYLFLWCPETFSINTLIVGLNFSTKIVIPPFSLPNFFEAKAQISSCHKRVPLRRFWVQWDRKIIILFVWTKNIPQHEPKILKIQFLREHNFFENIETIQSLPTLL